MGKLCFGPCGGDTFPMVCFCIVASPTVGIEDDEKVMEVDSEKSAAGATELQNIVVTPRSV